MNRRGFIAAIAGALAFDPERALWVPGKVISIPKPRARNVIQLGVEFDSLRLRVAALQRQVMAKAEFMRQSSHLPVSDRFIEIERYDVMVRI